MSKALKSLDVSASVYNPAYDIADFSLLNGILAGTGPSQMIGRRITIKSILLNYSVNNIAATSGNLTTYNPEVIRVVLVYDKEPQSTKPLVTDVFSTNSPVGPMNLANSSRFLVLYDQRHSMGCQNVLTGGATYANTTGPLTAFGTKYLKVALPMEGPSSAGGIAGINTGAIWFYAVSDSPNANGNATVTYYSRIRYYDA